MARVQLRISICSAGFLILVTAYGGTAACGAETVLHAFQGGTDGALPAGGLMADKAGNLYGTTYFGGGGACGPGACGTAFKLSSGGSESVVYAFNGGGHKDGEWPQGSLVADKAGNFYGTTSQGGAAGWGTVFKLAPDGTETVFYAFQGDSDGYMPTSGLIADAKGNLYGTTELGGKMKSADCNYEGCGTVFKITPTGKKTMLYTFQGVVDGIDPMAGLVFDGSGNLYGTTSAGGIGNCALNCGLIFKISSRGKESTLHEFQGGSDGAVPVAGLTVDAAGNLYGTTSYGGAGGSNCPEGTLGCGTVFKLAPDGTEAVLYAFQGGSDGWSPYAGVIEDKAGNFYGTTYLGGGTGCAHNDGCGTVFRLGADGKESVLYAFQGGSDGGSPEATLLAGKNGILYGTTTQGGTDDDGVVFSVEK
jgi:uncharacterized repeat protein (TIGR03803 family)